MENEYNLSWNSMVGFVLTKTRTRKETVLNEAQAFHWSDKSNVSVALSAQKRIDETMTLNTSFKFRRGW